MGKQSFVNKATSGNPQKAKLVLADTGPHPAEVSALDWHPRQQTAALTSSSRQQITRCDGKYHLTQSKAARGSRSSDCSLKASSLRFLHREPIQYLLGVCNCHCHCYLSIGNRSLKKVLFCWIWGWEGRRCSTFQVAEEPLPTWTALPASSQMGAGCPPPPSQKGWWKLAAKPQACSASPRCGHVSVRTTGLLQPRIHMALGPVKGWLQPPHPTEHPAPVAALPHREESRGKGTMK